MIFGNKSWTLEKAVKVPADRLEDRPTKAAQIIPNLLEDASHLQLAHPSYRFEAVSGYQHQL